MKMLSTLFQKPKDSVVRILGGKETGFPVSWAVHGLWEVPVSSQGLVPWGAAGVHSTSVHCCSWKVGYFHVLHCSLLVEQDACFFPSNINVLKVW